jgi:hypothetical protein
VVGGRRGASSPRRSPASPSYRCRRPCGASSSRSCQAPTPRRCRRRRRRRRRRRGLPAPPSRPRRKWTASPGNRCARRRGKSAPRARRSSAARAARWSCTPCPSSKVTFEGGSPGSERASELASQRWGCFARLCASRAISFCARVSWPAGARAPHDTPPPPPFDQTGLMQSSWLLTSP